MKAIASPPALPAFPVAYTPPAHTRESIRVVEDLPQLVERVLALKPHDQVEMILPAQSSRLSGREPSDTTEQRGYLMEIRVGPQSNLCVKRTF